MDTAELCPRVTSLLQAMGAKEIWTPKVSGSEKSNDDTYRQLERWIGSLCSDHKPKKGAAVLPYRLVYGKSANVEKWAVLFRRDCIQTVIQLPSGSLGQKNDQPLALIYEQGDRYADLEVLFVDATQVPRASERAYVLSEHGADMIQAAVETRASAGKALAKTHPLGGNRPLYLDGLPSMSKLVPRSDLPSEDTLIGDIAQNKQSIEKLRDKLRRLLD